MKIFIFYFSKFVTKRQVKFLSAGLIIAAGLMRGNLAATGNYNMKSTAITDDEKPMLSNAAGAGRCTRPSRAITDDEKPMLSNEVLEDVYQSDVIWNGVTTSAVGRVFVCFPTLGGEAGMSIGEVSKSGAVEPYPNADWNNWKVGDAPQAKFVRTNSLRIGPEGNLWVVDTGTEKMGSPVNRDGVKLVSIDLKKNQVVRTIFLKDYVKENSMIDDLRIGSSHIYLTDAGEPGLVILDRQTGKGRRILENQFSTIDRRSLIAEGEIMKDENEKESRIHADQLELSPDEKYLYFQPASGPMYRVETKFLRDDKLPAADLNKKVKLWFDTPTTGGTAIDVKGNVYVSDVNRSQILKITPDGKSCVLIKDQRLIWIDAMWIDGNNYLWLPAAQLNRAAQFQSGISKVKFPVHIYKLKL